MNTKRLAVLSGAFAAAGALAGAGWATERSAAQRLRAEESELRDAGLTIPSTATHHFIAASDGGRLHVVEVGDGGQRALGLRAGRAQRLLAEHMLAGLGRGLGSQGHC